MFGEQREWPVKCRYSSEPDHPGLDVGVLALRCVGIQQLSYFRIAILNHEASRCPTMAGI
jgi:hypothetical protein